MESDNDDSAWPASASANPRLFGLDTFGFDFELAMWGRDFGLDVPPYRVGAMELQSFTELHRVVAEGMKLTVAFMFAIHAIWHTLLCQLMKWLVAPNFRTTLFNWQIQFPEPRAIPIHLFLLLCASPTGLKDLTLVATMRYLARHSDPGKDTSIFVLQWIALLSYCMVSLICHNTRSILHLLFRPMVLLPILLLSLGYLGLLQLAFRQCKLFLIAITESIWVVLMKLLARFYSAHKKYTRTADDRGAAVPYEYAKLGPSEIRLVELHRSHPLARLGIRLLTCSLPSPSPYEAISYTWGDVTTNHTILINGCFLPVTRNASEALHAVAPFWGTRLVWIDSICINQQDPLDKNQQVPLLAEIYQRATRTLAWLGDSPIAEYAVLQLRRLRQVEVDKQVREEACRVMKQNVFDANSSQKWRAVSEFLSHQYWTRVWIIQELAVSRNVHIIYGIHRIPMDSVSEVVQGLINILDEYNNGDVFVLHKGFTKSRHCVWPSKKIEIRLLNLFNIKIISRYRYLIQQGQYPELWDAVEATKFCNATDPRDKIYAFCNIGTYSANTDLNPDYTISVKDLFIRFTKHYIKTHFQRFVISSRNYQPQRLRDLPSWVPDFTSNDNLEPDVSAFYSASGERRQTIIEFDSSNKIRLRGIYIDEITHLTSHAIDPSWNEDPNNVISSALHTWHEEAVSLAVANIPPIYPCSNESRRQAFIRTLIGDRNSDGTQAEVAYKKYYKYWCRFLGMSVETGAAPEMSASAKSEEATNARIFSTAVLRAGKSRRLAVTKGGYMALVPKETEVGDIICIGLGLQLPIVLRTVKMDDATKKRICELVGWCYCHGVMMGEAVESGESATFIIQ